MWIVIDLAFLIVIIVLASAASRKKPANEATRSVPAAQRIAKAESRLDELSSTQNALKEELTNYKNDAEELREFRKHTTNFVTLLAAAAWADAPINDAECDCIWQILGDPRFKFDPPSVQAAVMAVMKRRVTFNEGREALLAMPSDWHPQILNALRRLLACDGSSEEAERNFEAVLLGSINALKRPA
jgi:hypothetical protein